MRRLKRQLSVILSIFGIALLAYLAGAAAMYLQLPTSETLARSLHGGLAWYDGWNADSQPTNADLAPAIHYGIDQPAHTCDGFTLYSCVGPGAKQPYTQAFLINMRGEAVHRWSIPFSRIWPVPSHLPKRVLDSEACFFACHLFPNGDLLAVLHGRTKPMGCGLVKLDKDSNVLWAYPASIHHDIDVAEDGTIYAIQHEIASDAAEELEEIASPCEIDYLHVLSPEGKLLAEPISILAAFQDSPYAAFLDMLKQPLKRDIPARWATVPQDVNFMAYEPLHTNSVRVLNRSAAASFPLFQPGHVLVSIRDMNLLAMLDPESGKVAWAARGPWCGQHDAQFLGNGHLLLFDNLGVARGSRVLEYDPQTQAIPWFFAGAPGESFYSAERGLCQRLPNGNTLIVNSEGHELLEVTAAKEIVWSLITDSYINTARRYSREQLRFLDGGIHARP